MGGDPSAVEPEELNLFGAVLIRPPIEAHAAISHRGSHYWQPGGHTTAEVWDGAMRECVCALA